MNAKKLYLLVSLILPVFGQQNRDRSRIDVQSYLIDAQIDPAAQTINATALVRFIPLEDTSQLAFELNNSLSLSKVLDEDGRQVPASRTQADMMVRLNLQQALQKGKAAALTFIYDGKITGNEESPVFGIKFAAIHPDFAYFMYPARWFPVNDYTADRFNSDIKVTVPTGFKVVSSDIGATETAPSGMTAYRFQFKQASFPGSFAVVRGEPKQVSAGGVTTRFYARQSADMAQAYGEEIAKAVVFFTDVYGLPFRKDLTVVETEDGTPNGYAAPGILFFSPRGLGKNVNHDLVANEVSRQWWGTMVSPATRNHEWIENGMARYAEFLYAEHAQGAGAKNQEIHDSYVAALTVDQPPLIQAGRLEDYSPEFWAATAGKGAAVLNMLRNVIGDEAFSKVLKAIPERYTWKSISTDDLKKVAEEFGGQPLNWFFTEWIESSGAPEFKMEYTVFRTQKGFRVMGKVTQDLDLFRMPIDLKIETEGNPETKKIDVVGTSSEFAVETYGKPKTVSLDPENQVLHFDNQTRVAVAIRKGEQFTQIGEYSEALKEYQKALEVTRNSSLAHYRVAEIWFLEQNWQQAANEYREALNGDLDPKWTEVWAHINLGKIFDISDQRDRAVNEYRQALRTKDNTYGAMSEAEKYINQKFERPRSSN